MQPTPAQPRLTGTLSGHPKPKSYHRRYTGSCSPLTCCFSCIFNLIFQLLITIAIFVTIIGLIFWFIFRPNVPKFYVDDVTLAQFTISPTKNTLFYNLAVNMTFRKPNRRLGIYYESIEAAAVYGGRRLSTAVVQGFYLGHKEENNVGAVFNGEQLVVGGGAKWRYESEKIDGVYRIDLKLRLKIRFKVLWFESPEFKLKLDCDLRVPLSSKVKILNGRFERTKCDFDWYN